jgi:hypothetical protein
MTAARDGEPVTDSSISHSEIKSAATEIHIESSGNRRGSSRVSRSRDNPIPDSNPLANLASNDDRGSSS